MISGTELSEEQWDKAKASIDWSTLPGPDRDCAIAMLSQVNLKMGFSTIQVLHLLQIGYRAGVTVGRARERLARDNAKSAPAPGEGAGGNHRKGRHAKLYRQG